MLFDNFSQCYQQRVTAYIDQHLPSECTQPKILHQAMRYSVLNGGKRIRPLLVYALGQALNADDIALDAAAASVEIIHCYSLIHDDLPAMDDDDLRRGKATCHKAFDEATAILAGDALQAFAFEILLQSNLSAEQHVQLVKTLAIACGSLGMAGGQALDLAGTGKQLDNDYVKTMHSKKTGALITASCVMGAIAAGANPQQLTVIKQYGDLIGLAFQIQDDILDIESDTETLGKTQGADLEADKITYPATIGLEQSKKEVETLYNQALEELASIKLKTSLLAQLSAFLVRRHY